MVAGDESQHASALQMESFTISPEVVGNHAVPCGFQIGENFQFLLPLGPRKMVVVEGDEWLSVLSALQIYTKKGVSQERIRRKDAPSLPLGKTQYIRRSDGLSSQSYATIEPCALRKKGHRYSTHVPEAE